MKVKILIVGARVYEKDGQKNTRLVFVPIEKSNFQYTAKQVGYSDLAEYYNTDILKNLPKEFILSEVTGLFEDKPYAGNPFKSRSQLVGVEYENKVYNFI